MAHAGNERATLSAVPRAPNGGMQKVLRKPWSLMYVGKIWCWVTNEKQMISENKSTAIRAEQLSWKSRWNNKYLWCLYLSLYLKNACPLPENSAVCTNTYSFNIPANRLKHLFIFDEAAEETKCSLFIESSSNCRHFAATHGDHITRCSPWIFNVALRHCCNNKHMWADL